MTVVGVERRVAGGGADLARRQFEDDGRARLGLDGGHLLGERVLCVPLDVGVDGEPDVAAIHRWLVDPLGAGG